MPDFSFQGWSVRGFVIWNTILFWIISFRIFVTSINQCIKMYFIRTIARSLVWKWNHMLHFIPMVPISYNRKVKVKTTEVRENHTYTVTCSITWVSSEQLMKYTYMQWINCFDIFSMAKNKLKRMHSW